MNVYSNAVIKQMDLAVDSIIKLIESLNEEDLRIKPTEDKWSIGELLSHISVLSKADFLIGAGATEEELDRFYAEAEPEENKTAIIEALIENYTYLKEGIAHCKNRNCYAKRRRFSG